MYGGKKYMIQIEENSNAINGENNYSYYKFFEAMSKIIDEATIEFIESENVMRIRAMDPSGICLLEINRTNLDVKDQNIGLNLEDFMKLLSVNKSGEKELNLIFGREKLKIEKINKDGSKTTKTLGYLDVATEDIEMNTLLRIEYESKVTITNEVLADVFREFKYKQTWLTEIIGLKVDGNGFHAYGTCNVGDIVYDVRTENLYDIHGKNNNYSHYSLTFLNALRTLMTSLDKEHLLTLEMKNDHPLKVTVDFMDIQMSLVMFLAPRVEEIDFEDEDMYEF